MNRWVIATEDGRNVCSYDLRKGPYLTWRRGFAYTWDSAAAAEAQRPLYEKALSQGQHAMKLVVLEWREVKWNDEVATV